jgi:anaerobic selenocysteine-containing dehydrogenase
MYNPHRAVHPMSRTKGGQWKRVSWKEALNRAAEAFLDARERSGPRSVLFMKGTGRDIGPWLSRLAFGFGSPEYYALGPGSGSACLMPRMSVCASLFGGWFTADCSQYFPDRYVHPGWRPPGCILVWGSNPVYSNPDGFLGSWLLDCVARGSRLVVVDPRNTWLAGRAQVHLRLKPGTDGALAMAFLNRMAGTGRWNRKFTAEWVSGAETTLDAALDWPPSRASRECRVPEDEIRRGADLWLDTPPGALQWGVSVDMSRSALGTAHALASLVVLSGNLDVPGGCVIAADPFGIARRGGMKQPPGKTGSSRYPMTEKGFPYASSDVLLEEMEAGRDVACAWIQGSGTVLNGFADPERAAGCLSRIREVVVCDLFMTPTADRFGTVFLPVACYPERDGLRNWWYQLAAVQKAVEPLGEARSDMEIILDFGRRVAPESFPWSNVTGWFDHVLEPSGMTWSELAEKGWVMPGTEYGKHRSGLLRSDGNPGFETPSGRIELQPEVMERAGLLPAPWYVAPPDEKPGYPFVLSTGARTPLFFHSEHRVVRSLLERNPLPLVEVNPSDAAENGISDGCWVTISSPWGNCGRVARVTGIVPRGTLMAQHGWWQPELDEDTVSRLNVNNLLPQGMNGRGGLGYPFRCIPCRITPGPELLEASVPPPSAGLPADNPLVEINPGKCFGCRACEIVCLQRLGVSGGECGILVLECQGEYQSFIPRFTSSCLRCADTPCAAVCPGDGLNKLN